MSPLDGDTTDGEPEGEAGLVGLNVLTPRSLQDFHVERRVQGEETGPGSPETARSGHGLGVIDCWVGMKAQLWSELVATEAGLEKVRGRDPENRMEWPQSTEKLCSWGFGFPVVAKLPKNWAHGGLPCLDWVCQEEPACCGTGLQCKRFTF